MLLKIPNQRRNPIHRSGRGGGTPGLDSQPFRQSAGKGLHVARAQGGAMIRHRSRGGGRAFHHVEAVHGGFGAGDAALVRKVARIADRARSGAEEIRVQGNDDLRLIEVINGVEVFAEGQLRAFARPYRGSRAHIDATSPAGTARAPSGSGPPAWAKSPCPSECAIPRPYASRSSARFSSMEVRNVLQSPMRPTCMTTWARSGS